MKTLFMLLLTTAGMLQAQNESSGDRRVERAKGYHIVSRPARSGETPPEVKQEKADEDRRRGNRNNTDISNQTVPTREPELKPKTLQP